VFPGVTVDDVKANTGFEVKTAKKSNVQPPSKQGSGVAERSDKTASRH
jgi:hypothetical protein